MNGYLFSSTERRGANRIARLPCVLDMEAAFDQVLEDEDPLELRRLDRDQGRLDLVVLNQDGRLVFIEAKLYASQDLWAVDQPAVCGQLELYYGWIQEHQEELLAAYKNVLHYWSQLDGDFFQRRRDYAPLVPFLNGCRAPVVDPVPRLLIFGYDGQQEARVHAQQNIICNAVQIPGFGVHHIRCVGSPQNVGNHHLQ